MAPQDNAQASSRLVIALVVPLCAALTVYLLINWMYIWNLADGAGSRSLWKTTAQAGLLLFAFLALMFGPMSLRGVFKWVFAACFVASIAANFTVYWIMNMLPKRQIGVWLLAEIGRSENAFSAWGMIVVSMLAVAILGVGLLAFAGILVRHRTTQLLGPQRSLAFRIAALLSALSIPLVGGAMQTNMGLAESNAYAFGIVALRLETPRPAPLQILPRNEPAAEKIVLVVDESIRPDAFAEVVLPVLPPHRVEYGKAYSSANCSAATNALMRWGIVPSQLNSRHDPRGNVHLWSYAQQAGFRTVLIDAQIQDPLQAQNFLSGYERDMIGELLAMDVGIESDAKVAEEIARRLKSPGREFIYVIKRGAHFPYEKNLPFGSVDPGMSQQEVYRRAVSYTTGRFFKKLLALSSDMERTLLLYTSDHGQFFGGVAVHCSGNFFEEEFEVPMLVLGAPTPLLHKLEAAAPCWSGGANHQSLRTVAIEAMGYAPENLGAHLFPSLSVCPTEQRLPRFIGYLPFLSASDDELDFRMLEFRNQRSMHSADGPTSSNVRRQ